MAVTGEINSNESTFSIIQEIETLARLTKSNFREFQHCIVTQAVQTIDAGGEFAILNFDIPTHKSLIITKIDIINDYACFGLRVALQITNDNVLLTPFVDNDGLEVNSLMPLASNVFYVLQGNVQLILTSFTPTGSQYHAKISGYLVDSKIAKKLQSNQTFFYYPSNGVLQTQVNPIL
jgi:hypothetical protein